MSTLYNEMNYVLCIDDILKNLMVYELFIPN